MIEDQDLAECATALARSQLYGLTAQLLSGPERVLDEELFEALSAVAGETVGFTDIAENVKAAREAVRDLSPSPRDLNREYTGLFLKGEVSPYECTYVPPSRMSQELADIAGFFTAFGLQPGKDRQDHLVSELEFMALLCLKESVAVGNGSRTNAEVCQDAEVKFLKDHLGRWVGVFRRLLADKAGSPVYPRLSAVVHKVVTSDAAYLGLTLDEIREVPEDDAQGLPGCGIGAGVAG